MLKRLFIVVLALCTATAQAQFTPGQVLKAQDLNNALATKSNVTDLSGTGSSQGGGLVAFTQSATYQGGTVGGRLQQTISIKDAPYNAKCDGSTDDYAAIMAAYNAAPAGATLSVPAGTCVVKTAPVFGTKRIAWRGAGSRSSTLLYAGTNTTNDAFTFGSVGGELNGIRIEGIGFASSTVMTAGAGVHFIKLTRSALRDVLFGHQDGNGNFYHGVWFDGVDLASVDIFQARAQQDAVRVNGNGPKADLFLTGGKIASSNVGLHVGGDFGGLQVDTTDIINNATNVLIDKTINTAANNRETFFGPGAMIDTADTTKTATTYNGIGVDIQDTGGFIFFSGTWNATAGTLVRIGSAYTGTVKFDAGFLLNAFTAYGGNGRAIDNASTNAEVVINGTRFDNVQGAGLYSSVGTSKFILNNPIFNTNVTAPVSSNIAAVNRWTYQSQNQAVMGKMAIGSRSLYGSGVSVTPDISSAGSNLNLTYWGSDAASYWLSLGHSKSGTTGTQAAVNSGDQLGAISFEGSDGTAFRSSAQVLGMAAGTPSGGQVPGQINFRTNDGTSTVDRAILSSSGNFGIGVTPSFGFHLSGKGNPSAAIDYYEAGTGGAAILIRKARGTQTVPSAVQSGDYIGGLISRGYGATAYQSANTGLIGFKAAENFTDTAGGTDFVVETTTTGGTSRTEKARVTGSGIMYVGRTSQIAGEKLSVNGQVLGIASNSALTAYNATGQTSIMLNVGDAATDQHKTELYATTAGGFTIRSVDDAYSTSASVLTANRGAGVAWSSITLNSGKFSLDSSGNALVKATGGLGYGAGGGGVVTQATSKTTGVTLNTPSGQITMNAAALAAAATACFTLTNSTIAATDVVNTSIASGATAGAYTLQVDAVAAGSSRMCVNNRSAGSLSEAIVINYAVIKGSAN